MKEAEISQNNRQRKFLEDAEKLQNEQKNQENLENKVKLEKENAEKKFLKKKPAYITLSDFMRIQNEINPTNATIVMIVNRLVSDNAPRFLRLEIPFPDIFDSSIHHVMQSGCLCCGIRRTKLLP